MSEQNAITVKRQTMDIMSLGNALASSGYFTDATQQAQAVVKVLAGQELGLGPIASMTGIHIIKGKPVLSSNMMAAVIKNHPHYDYKILETGAKKVSIEFFNDGESIGVSEFTIQDAQTADLTSGNNAHSWRKFPRNMLFARALSNGAKWFCPDAFSGVPPYTPDEFDVVIDGESGEIVKGEPVATAHTGKSYPSDDASIWLPSLNEFQSQCETDFKLPFNEIKTILKEHCNMTGFLSANATNMYNCLCDYFTKQRNGDKTVDLDEGQQSIPGTEPEPTEATHYQNEAA